MGCTPTLNFCLGLITDILTPEPHMSHGFFRRFFSTTTTESKVYFFDPRQFQQTKFGTLKTGAFRALFLLQSVRVLKRRLRAIGRLAWKHIGNCSRELLFSFWYLHVFTPYHFKKNQATRVNHSVVTSGWCALILQFRVAKIAEMDWLWCVT